MTAKVTATAFISLDHVNKAYHSSGEAVAALQDVSLAIGQGEMVAIIGPSGSGKSTLLTVMGGMNAPTQGQVIIDGVDVYHLPGERQADFRRDYVGFVFQQLHLVPYLTVIENVMLPLVINRGGNSRLERARQALEQVGLADKARRLPDQLSGGEQTRVAIARAVVNGSPLLLCDEPTGGLDSRTGAEVLQLLQNLNRQGHTVIIVTHNIEATDACRRVIALRDGRIVAGEGTALKDYT